MLFIFGSISSLVMSYAVLNAYIDRAVSLRTTDVQTQFKILANHLTTYNYLQDTSSEVINAELDLLSNLYDGRVLIIDENMRVIKDTYGISEGKTVISEEVIECFKGESISNYDERNQYIEMTTPIMEIDIPVMIPDTTDVFTENVEEKEVVGGVMLTSVNTDSIMQNYDFLSRKGLVLQIVMWITLVGISIAAATALVRPFARVTAAINEVKAGFTDEEIVVADYLETERIIDAFNQLLARMKVLDDSRQEFVSNVSHELKTPITSMKVLADSLNAQEDVPIELYQEFMHDIADEIDRESHIIDNLLSLVKMDKTATDLDIVQVDVNALLELILKRLTPIAGLRNIELVLECIRAVTAEVDEVKMTLALSNLVENAIKYNKENGSVKVTLDADHQYFTVVVADTGIGIPSEELEHIYERFYRVDKSHSREIGGTGLGLAITRSSILMHRGSVQVESTEGEGTVFTAKIPLSYIV